MRTTISYWSKLSEDKTSREVYLVPLHGAQPPLPLYAENWTPVSISFEDRAMERFMEECTIYKLHFISPSEIERITGEKSQMVKFNQNYM